MAGPIGTQHILRVFWGMGRARSDSGLADDRLDT